MVATLRAHREERETVSNQLWFDALCAFVGDRHSLWKQGGGALNPKGTSKVKLKDGVRKFVGAEERTGILGRGRCLSTDRINHPGTGKTQTEPSLCCWAA